MEYNLKELLSVKTDNCFYRMVITKNVDQLEKHLKEQGIRVIDRIEGSFYDMCTDLFKSDTEIFVSIRMSDVVEYIKRNNPSDVSNEIFIFGLVRTIYKVQEIYKIIGKKNTHIIFINEIQDKQLKSTDFGELKVGEFIEHCPSKLIYQCPVMLRYDFKGYKSTCIVIKHRDMECGLVFDIDESMS